MADVVRFEGIGVSLGGRPVLLDIDLAVGPGSALGISGPNGSGKTTLVRTAATLTRADIGRLTVLGTGTDEVDLPSLRRSIGMIGHQPALIGELTLTENLEHVARLAEIDPARVSNALEVVGLSAASGLRAEACSFGMKRRVEIARLLLTKPRLLLLDEAASGLDNAARDLVTALVGSVLERGGGAILVSHDAEHLRSLCTETLRIERGRLMP